MDVAQVVEDVEVTSAVEGGSEIIEMIMDAVVDAVAEEDVVEEIHERLPRVAIAEKES
jgi:hypothetical protein